MTLAAVPASTSYKVRAELEGLLERDLLGPADGPTEELPPRTQPAERYILGRLSPRDAPSTPDGEGPDGARGEDSPAELDSDAAETGDEDDDTPGPAAVRSGSMAASSLGLAFSVPADLDVVRVEARWGRYEQQPSEVHDSEATGRPTRVWKRHPAGGPVEVRLDTEGELEPQQPDPEREGVVLRALVRHRGRRRVVDLALVNAQSSGGGHVDTVRMYQVELDVTALDGHQAIFLGHNDPEYSEPPDGLDDERAHLELLYRNAREYAQGRKCAVDAVVRDGEQRAWKLTTTSFPAADVRLTVPADPRDLPGAVLDMSRLGSPEMARDDLIRGLRPLATAYRQWLTGQSRRLEAEPELAQHAATGRRAIEQAGRVADRLDRAVDLLKRDGLAREAFRFANQAMAAQRVRSEVVRQRMSGSTDSVDDLLDRFDVPRQRSWRPFQLAFVLLCLPGLTDPGHEDAHRGWSDGEVNLLFFPTGGGKTEAYLGLAAYTFAIRRLQGVVGAGGDARDGTTGVAVLMRYTLRLLTAQQFQRAAALLCACEALRRERVAGGDLRWGDTPFRIGLWVGAKVTPGTYDAAAEQIAQSQDDGGVGGPLQLAACPWCGSALTRKNLSTDKLRRRVLLHCSDPEGRCLYSAAQSPDEGLPVLTVDEEIYRLTPALVISTVDKLAQLPWSDRLAALFGVVDTRCPRHGWRLPSMEGFCRTRHPAAGGLPATQLEPALRLRPPDLIIQDELHLISDALGSLVGLYETVVDLLCSRPGPGGPIRPVVAASTATVRRAAEQVEQVFARDLTVFPPPVLDANETFFSTVVDPSPATPSRRYRGVYAPGMRLKALEIRLAAAVLEHAQLMLDRHGAAADPYLTLVDYFTSTRELAGMRRLIDDDIADRLASGQVTTRRRRPQVAELTSRMPASRISQTLADLERPFDPKWDSSAALDELRAAARERRELPPRPTPQALDVLLATSMLQVGVDVQRLGLMLVTGQPKNTAEYLQASSRVGRDTGKPGLVIVMYHWNRPRDLAHFETFGHLHATLGRRVEGLTTTPFSDRAIDRGLSAVLVAALRHAGAAGLQNTAADGVPLTGAAVDVLVEHIAHRAGRVTHSQDVQLDVAKQLEHRLANWSSRRDKLPTGRLGYVAEADVTALLRDPDDGDWQLWSAPRSLREVEAEVTLQLAELDPSVDSAPDWAYDDDQTVPAGGRS